MSDLRLETANTVIATAFAKGAENGLKPLAVAVLDAGGHLVAFQRQDLSSLMRFQIAFGKAWGALALGMGSRGIDAMARERPHFMAALSDAAGGRLVPVPGGVLMRDAAGRVLGAVGVTGDTSDNDEAAAIVGIEAAGLVADGG
ncbi:heme-binding protein [Nitratireductor sp. StC3]|uniref:GlcG/HbpS family heme-binding protein n=1 Tax=Nitratireductor sp. StC3 TaxID=2126741 RepID=UPI000D0D38C8|nr:heme-binding protein [Nitratireductor sp. StC3]PSM19209.1 GlcG protein [Nitratireductor sp. StC3]